MEQDRAVVESDLPRVKASLPARDGDLEGEVLDADASIDKTVLKGTFELGDFEAEPKSPPRNLQVSGGTFAAPGIAHVPIVAALSQDLISALKATNCDEENTVSELALDGAAHNVVSLEAVPGSINLQKSGVVVNADNYPNSLNVVLSEDGTAETPSPTEGPPQRDKEQIPPLDGGNLQRHLNPNQLRDSLSKAADLLNADNKPRRIVQIANTSKKATGKPISESLSHIETVSRASSKHELVAGSISTDSMNTSRTTLSRLEEALFKDSRSSASVYAPADRWTKDPSGRVSVGTQTTAVRGPWYTFQGDRLRQVAAVVSAVFVLIYFYMCYSLVSWARDFYETDVRYDLEFL